MIKSLGLTNYKSFKNMESIELKPLTLFCGVNSGGKSSIIKSLLMMKQTSEETSRGAEVALNGPLVVNGSMKDVLYKHSGQEFTIYNSVAIKNQQKMAVQDAKQDIEVSRELQKIFNIQTAGCFDLDVWYTFKKKKSGIAGNDNYLDKIVLNVYHHPSSENERQPLAKLFFNYTAYGRYTIRIKLLILNDKGFKDIFNATLEECTCIFNGIRLNNMYCRKVNTYVDFNRVFPIIISLLRISADQYSGIRYIGPLRDSPERGYANSKNSFSNSQTGSINPFKLRAHQNKLIKDKLYPPVSEENFGELIPFQSLGSTKQYTLINVLNSWMQYLGLGEVTIDGIDDVCSIKIDGENIVDVGFGLSQILPIVTESLALEKGQTLILEQPEIHLHPKMQMNLTDLFIRLSEYNRNIVIETHSDHIINRIVRRILEYHDNSLNDNIAIYYIEKSQDGSIVYPISIDRVKGIVECPNEFFTQFASETRYIFNAGMNNIGKE